MNSDLSKMVESMETKAQWEVEKQCAPLRTADSLQSLYEMLSAEIKETHKDSKVNRIIALFALVVAIFTLIATIMA